MRKQPIYTDLDNVLVYAILDPKTDRPVDLVVHPDAGWFLETVSRYGDLSLLTSANLDWATYALKRLGRSAKHFSHVYTNEDLYPVAAHLEMIERAHPRDREELHEQVASILPPGVIFDDYPVKSWMYLLKGLATGITRIDPELWITVEKFEHPQEKSMSLRRAFGEFLKRNAGWNRTPRLGGPKGSGLPPGFKVNCPCSAGEPLPPPLAHSSG
jgi:hypothetical protein